MSQKRFFEYMDTDENGILSFKATIQLPDDGTPGSSRFLVIQVDTGPDQGSTIGLEIDYPELYKTKHIAHLRTEAIDNISELLYPAATLKTVKKLIPN